MLRSRWAWPLAIVLQSLSAQQPAYGQTPQPAPRDSTKAAKDTTQHHSKWRFIHRNEIETPFFTFRLGGAVLMDYAMYSQDSASRAQLAPKDEPDPPSEPPERIMPADPYRGGVATRRAETTSASQAVPGDLRDDFTFRDTRFMLGGIIKTKRPTTWTAGVMWDAATRKFLIRQTGIIVAVPEIWGHLWIGRSKEGFSLNRVMVGYDGWTMERFAFSESIPLLADGIKWLGYVPNKNLIWSLGVFADPLSKGQTFSSYKHQAVGRIAYLKMESDSATLLHVGLAGRIGRPTNDTLHIRAKPESTTAPFFIDTGKFPAELAGHVGVEAYYRPGSWLFGGEYYVEKVDSPETGDPLFHGGDISAIWLVSGEIRPYETKGSFFRAILPKRPVFEGGWGALELLLRLSYIDLTDGTLEGGTFWRITPGFNWYLNRNLRLEVGYGYGVLDRFALQGATQFFQLRMQSQF